MIDIVIDPSLKPRPPPSSVAPRPGQPVRLKLQYPAVELEPGGAAYEPSASDQVLILERKLEFKDDELRSVRRKLHNERARAAALDRELRAERREMLQLVAGAEAAMYV